MYNNDKYDSKFDYAKHDVKDFTYCYIVQQGHKILKEVVGPISVSFRCLHYIYHHYYIFF